MRAADTAEPTIEFFATANPGTERALFDELSELSFRSLRPQTSGVLFRGGWQEGWRACLHSRVAQRVMAVAARFRADSADLLYAGVRRIDWSPFLTPDRTFAIGGFSVGSTSDTRGFLMLRAKDAIADAMRELHGKRPNVDRDDPDVRIFLYVAGDRVTVYADLAGDPLSRRGYRTESVDAPLQENMAAAILRMAGWDRQTPLLDPMCGSGTFAIEAALWSRNMAPGLLRGRFGFERWASFDTESERRLKALCGAARRAADRTAASVTGADIDPAALEIAGRNARRAGVRLALKQRAIEDWQSDTARRFIILNPPYNVRLDADPEFCRRVTGALCRMHGSRVAFISALAEYRRVMSINPVAVFPLRNGDLACELVVYEVPKRASS